MSKTYRVPPPLRSRSGAAFPSERLSAPPRHAAEPDRPFSRIVVPLDLTGDTKTVLRTALLVAHASRAAVTLVNVIPWIGGASARAEASFYREVEEAAKKKLAEIARQFRKRHLAVREEVRLGDPLAEILACAKRAKADLIILRSHRFVPNEPGHGWGTVSYKVASLCECPVLLSK